MYDQTSRLRKEVSELKDKHKTQNASSSPSLVFGSDNGSSSMSQQRSEAGALITQAQASQARYGNEVLDETDLALDKPAFAGDLIGGDRRPVTEFMSEVTKVPKANITSNFHQNNFNLDSNG
jgi:hypothetical protein